MPRFDYQLSPRDVEEEVVLRYTNNAYDRLEDIPQAKVEAILRQEARGGAISKQLVDRILKDEKKAVDNAVKDVRREYGYSVGQVAVNDFYKRFYNVMSQKFKDAAFRLAGVRMGLEGENMGYYRPRYSCDIRFGDTNMKFVVKKAWDEALECRNSMWGAISEAAKAGEAVRKVWLETKDRDAEEALDILQAAKAKIKELYRSTDQATDIISILRRRYEK